MQHKNDDAPLKLLYSMNEEGIHEQVPNKNKYKVQKAKISTCQGIPQGCD